MRVEFTPLQNAQVRVVPDIQLSRVTLLEGLNGIGKTTAVRLLMVCAGLHPYPTERESWRSFRDFIGHFRVTATGLNGVEEILWEFDSTKWPEDTTGVVENVWFTKILIDREPATLADVTRLLAVERMAGDRSIAENFADELASVTGLVDRERVRIDQLNRSEDSDLGRSLQLIEHVQKMAFRGDVTALEDVTLALERIAVDRERLQHDQDAQTRLTKKLEEIVELLSGLADDEAKEPELEAALKKSQNDVEATAADLNRSREELAALLARTDVDKSQEELQRARRNIQSNERQLDALRVQIADLSTELSVLPEAASIDNESQKERDAVDNLEIQIGRTSEIPGIIALTARSREFLEATELPPTTQILPASYSSDPTIGGLRSALESRAGELSHVPPTVDMDRLERTRRGLLHRLSALENLRTLLEKKETVAQRVVGYQKRIDRLSASGAADAIESAAALTTAIETADLAYEEAVQQRAQTKLRLHELRSGGSPELRRARAVSLLKEVGLTEDTAADALNQALTVTHERKHAIGRLEDDSVRLKEERERQIDDISRGVTALSTSGQFEWLRQLEQPFGWHEDSRDDPRAAAKALGALSARVTQAESLPNQLVTNLIGLSNALSSWSGHLRSGGNSLRNESGPDSIHERVRLWANRRFSDYLAQPTIVEGLLEGRATGVRFEIDNATVTWTEGEVERSRRLDSFSSGQQAYVYASARLKAFETEHSGVPNRIICMDEFGALLDHEHRALLEAHLVERARGVPSDSVLLVLPYLETGDADALIGEARKALLRRQEEIQDHGYVTRDLL